MRDRTPVSRPSQTGGWETGDPRSHPQRRSSEPSLRKNYMNSTAEDRYIKKSVEIIFLEYCLIFCVCVCVSQGGIIIWTEVEHRTHHQFVSENSKNFNFYIFVHLLQPFAKEKCLPHIIICPPHIVPYISI